uniref:Uncharacterized protein n=1 Tax=Arundo donax TaxID=35708 RepID=A0A0A9E4R9_ARUDO
MGGPLELVGPGSPCRAVAPQLPILPSAAFHSTAPTEHPGSRSGCSVTATPFGSSYLALMQTVAPIGFMDHSLRWHIGASLDILGIQQDLTLLCLEVQQF